MGKSKLWIGIMLLSLVATAGACGGPRGDRTGSGTTDPLALYPKGPTREFIIPGGDNAVPEYGREGTRAERHQASRMIQGMMQARAAKDFIEECRYFSRRYIRALVAEDAELVSEGKVGTCPEALDYFGWKASGNFRNTLTGSIDSLRVPSSRESHAKAVIEGFAMYHGKDGIDYVVPLHREAGKWWVAGAAPLSRG